jgi:hypothetical protein
LYWDTEEIVWKGSKGKEEKERIKKNEDGENVKVLLK